MNPDAKLAADTLRKMADFKQMLAFSYDTGKIINAAADLIESLAAELEQVERERDGLSIMLTSAMSAAHTFKRKLEEAGSKCVISPLAQGRMNGRHDGYNVLFSAIDEIPEKPCGTCVNRDWDMPQCRECNSTNNFRWYVKEA